jgi:hypothetical protein
MREVGSVVSLDRGLEDQVEHRRLATDLAHHRREPPKSSVEDNGAQ